MDKYVIAPPSGSNNNSVGAEDRPWKEGHFDSVKLNGGDLGEYLAESTGYGIVSGCEPTISGLTVTVGAGVVHLADGTRKEINASSITLDAADASNPRIDLVYITSTGTVAKVTGTTAASPVVPSVPENAIGVAIITIPANATTGAVIYNLEMLFPQKRNLLQSFDKLRRITHVNTTSGYAFQGMDYDETRDVLYVATINGSNQQIMTLSINFVNDLIDSFTIVSTTDYTELGHCNSVAYCPDNDKIYVLHELTDGKCSIINPSTMEVESVFDLPRKTYSLAYDTARKCFIGMCFDSNATYTTWQYSVYSRDFTTVKQINIPSPNPNSTGNFNGICCHDGRVVMLTLYCMAEIDIDTESIVCLQWLDNDIEFEEPAYYNGRLIINGLNFGNKIYEMLDNENAQYPISDKITTIQPVDNINADQINAGKYYVTNATNTPYASGILCVDKCYVSQGAIRVKKQIVQTLFGENNKVYSRVYTNDNWNDWVRVDSLGAIPSTVVTNITTNDTSGEYTPTDNGWLTLITSSCKYAYVFVKTATTVGSSDRSGEIDSGYKYVSIPVRKNQTIKWGTDGTIIAFRFVAYS